MCQEQTKAPSTTASFFNWRENFLDGKYAFSILNRQIECHLCHLSPSVI